MAAPFRLDEKVTVRRKTTQRDPVYGTEINTWETVADRVWANVQFVLPSRAEKSENGLRMSAHPARLRVRKQHMLTAEMSVTLHNHGDQVMQIIAGPSPLDDREHIECMMEAYANG
jgi:head-tail adaptor